MNVLKHFGQLLEVHASRRTYFWGEDLGYFVHSKTSSPSLTSMDNSINQLLRNSIKDLDKVRELMYNIKRELACTRLHHPHLGLTYPLVFTAMFTNFMQDEAYVLDTKENTHNLFMIEGDTPCGVGYNRYMRLKTYSSYADFFEEVANMVKGKSEQEQLEWWFNRKPFSLTMYRMFTVLVLLLLKGEDIIAKESLGVLKKMDSLGRIRDTRVFSGKGKLKKRFFGRAKSYVRRPRGTGEES